MKAIRNLSSQARQYLLITANYCAFTLTDGALRMLVLLYFHQLGYSPLAIALLFLFYEIFGVLTNLVGGWLGARFGLNKTMNIGLALQILALAMLMVPSHLLSVTYVMAAQALSGIAKDLNKMSAKSAIKLLVPEQNNHQLYQWVARLTGSKNTLKGLGYFLGGLLLACLGFTGAISLMAALLTLVWLISLIKLPTELGKATAKAKFSQLFSNSAAINLLSAARLFLFAARDVWFVVALPVYLARELTWSHTAISAFIAVWIIFYGVMQVLAPKMTFKASNRAPTSKDASLWGAVLVIVPVSMISALQFELSSQWTLLLGLLVFALIFAINSALHSYLIVAMARRDGVSLDVGFYYMANACGRLLGTVLSGWVFQAYGLSACLVISAIFIALAALFAALIKRFSLTSA
ncbi:Predicted arabinose efflux permease, MFS family [Colwellia chukchiensis]|uniref:Predicted arabinose efflux permease, MFS family n=1 Tax=Colwellia chukchiensis TaxID=641665 RepID=A0A1H7G1Z4_9GAMM|nr:organoarsenical effux MFS transporter ArsJ [Colwellia chukchiensis]SEK32373.1 Predicted arabinose efflux permease, MFS family [Colwellia chukchiensis]